MRLNDSYVVMSINDGNWLNGREKSYESPVAVFDNADEAIKYVKENNGEGSKDYGPDGPYIVGKPKLEVVHVVEDKKNGICSKCISLQRWNRYSNKHD